MRGSWFRRREEARTYTTLAAVSDFATRTACSSYSMSRAVGTWRLMVWRSEVLLRARTTATTVVSR